ncbi:hypothetical protein BT96DRAFT_1007128 [Gymnopus androsaceus JB14]|uniref:Uncharacterized protein n=1 Tax=Gymnopus androsaceus JB14 TaxID=1447944 RepID=A0A6A4GIG4_9AGAR|nr:hypothetical protein BT96DRAFT_1007128 [Gymnopus androsaceus JB14]
MKDEERRLKCVARKVEVNDPALALQILLHWQERGCFNDLHQLRLLSIKKLDGFAFENNKYFSPGVAVAKELPLADTVDDWVSGSDVDSEVEEEDEVDEVDGEIDAWGLAGASSSKPAPLPLPLPATDQKAPCASKSHIADKDETRDRWWNPSEQKWFVCAKQPCPNRYDTPHKDTKYTAELPDYADLPDIGQEQFIKVAENERQEKRRSKRLAGKQKAAASSSSNPTPAPTPSPAPVSLPKQEPQQTPPPLPPNPSPQPSPQQTPQPLPNSGSESSGAFESDSDDNNMSKALKAFDKVTTLKSDGSNWDTWKTRVEFAARSIGYQRYFEWNPHVITDPDATENDREKDNNLLNAIIGRLSGFGWNIPKV